MENSAYILLSHKFFGNISKIVEPTYYDTRHLKPEGQCPIFMQSPKN